MRFHSATPVVRVVVAVLVLAGTVPAAQTTGSGKQAPAANKKAASGTSLTGCVDEKAGHYVLLDERNLEPVAGLEADGFPTEGFAKHVGHKVTVRGTSRSESTGPVFKVRTIETLSETCEPTPQSDRK